MAWRAIAATVPKDEGDQNQDAFAKGADWIAIADGSSSGFDSGSWARALVAEAAVLCGDPLRHHRPNAEERAAPAAETAATRSGSAALVAAAGRRLEALQSRHHSVAHAPRSGADSPYVRDAQARGGSSTLAFARLSTDQRQLTLFAMGDTCWFVIRSGTVRFSFPYHAASEFPEQPRLLYSTPGRLGAYSRAIALTRAIRTLWDPKHPASDLVATVPFEARTDQLLGCTDAIAQWLLPAAALERSRRLRQLLTSLGVASDNPARIEKPQRVSAMAWARLQRKGKSAAHSNARHATTEFDALVDRERAANHLKRDDSTVVLSTWEEGGPP